MRMVYSIVANSFRPRGDPVGRKPKATEQPGIERPERQLAGFDPASGREQWPKGWPGKTIHNNVPVINLIIYKLTINKLNLSNKLIQLSWIWKVLTPTPNPFIDTMVNAASNVVITPTTNAAGSMAKLIRLRKWCPNVLANEQIIC